MSDPNQVRLVPATVRIAFDDADGHHAVDDQVTIAIENDEQRDNLVRLVEQGILEAQVPPTWQPPVFIPPPDPGGQPSATPSESIPAPDFTHPGGSFPFPVDQIPESEPTEQPPPPDDAAGQEPTS